MKTLEITIENASGLHARPATEFVKRVKGFACAITLRKGEKEENAKSLIKLLKLGIVRGEVVTFTLDGEDEEEAVTAITQFFQETHE